jgi:hypothetical protein
LGMLIKLRRYKIEQKVLEFLVWMAGVLLGYFPKNGGIILYILLRLKARADTGQGN